MPHRHQNFIIVFESAIVWCVQDDSGKDLAWVDSGVSNELLFGEEGWCNVAMPQHKCVAIHSHVQGPCKQLARDIQLG